MVMLNHYGHPNVVVTGKVTIQGRVMNCLEQVIIHDGYGHPIYFRTFSGNADLQKHALQSMENLNGLLNKTYNT